MGIRNLFNNVKRILDTPITLKRAKSAPNPTKAAIDRADDRMRAERKRTSKARAMNLTPAKLHRQSRTWSRKLDRLAIKRAEIREQSHVEPLRIRLLTDPAYLRKVARDNASFPVVA